MMAFGWGFLEWGFLGVGTVIPASEVVDIEPKFMQAREPNLTRKEGRT